MPPWGLKLIPAIVVAMTRLKDLADQLNLGPHNHARSSRKSTRNAVSLCQTSLHELGPWDTESEIMAWQENESVRLTLLIGCIFLHAALTPGHGIDYLVIDSLIKQLKSTIREILQDVTYLELLGLLTWQGFVAGMASRNAEDRNWYWKQVQYCAGYVGGDWMAAKQIVKRFVWVDLWEDDLKLFWNKGSWRPAFEVY
jgi:hypothetical protein